MHSQSLPTATKKREEREKKGNSEEKGAEQYGGGLRGSGGRSPPDVSVDFWKRGPRPKFYRGGLSVLNEGLCFSLLAVLTGMVKNMPRDVHPWRMCGALWL